MTPDTLLRWPALLRVLAIGLALLGAVPVQAQFRVDVAGIGLNQLPIAVSTFRGEDAAPQKIAAIVQADLERSGQFRAVDAAGGALDELSRPDVTLWRQKGADSLVTGSVARLADGRYDVRFRLWDVVRGQDLGGQSYAVTQGDLRLAAHRIADFVYEKLTGDKGAFSTRIAYVTKNAQRYQLWVADADGDLGGRRGVEPGEHGAHLVAADAHASPGGISVGDVQEDSRYLARNPLRVHRDVDGIVVDRAGVIEVLHDR